MPNQKYLCILRSESGACEDPSPTQMDDMFTRFQAWQEKFQQNIVDLGGKLGDGKVLTPEGVIDGPFVEVKEIIGGFMIVAANNLDEAVEVVRQCPPVADSNASVEIREMHTL